MVEDWNEKEKDRDGCYRKHLEILRRLWIKTSHEEIRELCKLWGCLDPTDFWAMMNTMDDDELFRAVTEAIKKTNAKKNNSKAEEEIAAYA